MYFLASTLRIARSCSPFVVGGLLAILCGSVWTSTGCLACDSIACPAPLTIQLDTPAARLDPGHYVVELELDGGAASFECSVEATGPGSECSLVEGAATRDFDVTSELLIEDSTPIGLLISAADYRSDNSVGGPSTVSMTVMLDAVEVLDETVEPEYEVYTRGGNGDCGRCSESAVHRLTMDVM